MGTWRGSSSTQSEGSTRPPSTCGTRTGVRDGPPTTRTCCWRCSSTPTALGPGRPGTSSGPVGPPRGTRFSAVDGGAEAPKHLRNPNSGLAHFEAALHRLEQRRDEARADERAALVDDTAEQVQTARKARNIRTRKRRTKTPS